MANDIAIRVEDIGKSYRIGRRRERYLSLREVIVRAALAPVKRARKYWKPNERLEDKGANTLLWALKDVSFEVKRGDIVALIGSNGAGKSTLLKLLSRVTEPTKGRAEIFGRIGSLLEVGTGFHPELTGRDNVYLNGAILGMKKYEIDRKFDEIVEFAEVARFIDTPVKHYSSGMYMRLAFAVAAHLESEILLVDEVLAVGDVAFQRKCLGRIEEVAGSGRTVLLVSHSMASLSSLCRSGIVLRAGEIDYAGDVHSAIRRYVSSQVSSKVVDLRSTMHQRKGTGEVRVAELAISAADGNRKDVFNTGDHLTFDLLLSGRPSINHLLFVVLVRTETGIPVLHLTNDPAEPVWISDNTRVRCELPCCPLYPGRYIVSLWIGRNAYQEIDVVPDVRSLTIEQNLELSQGFDVSWRHGLCHCDTAWSVSAAIDDNSSLDSTGDSTAAYQVGVPAL